MVVRFAILVVTLLGWTPGIAGLFTDKTGNPTPETTLPLPDASICGGARWIDEGLVRTGTWWREGEDKTEIKFEEINRTILRFSPSFRTDNGFKDYAVKASGRGRLDVPLFRDWLRVEFGDYDDETEEALHEDDIDREDLDDANKGGRWDDWKKADIGLGWDHGPLIRFRGRYGTTRDDGNTVTTLDQTGWWRSDDGFGTRSRIRWLFRTSEDTRLHASVDATYKETGRGLELSQLVGWYKDLENLNRFGVRALALEHTHPSVEADAVYLRTYLRHRLDDWMYIHFEPGIGFRADEDFDPLPTLNVKLEMFFGNVCDESLGWFYRQP